MSNMGNIEVIIEDLEKTVAKMYDLRLDFLREYERATGELEKNNDAAIGLLDMICDMQVEKDEAMEIIDGLINDAKER